MIGGTTMYAFLFIFLTFIGRQCETEEYFKKHVLRMYNQDLDWNLAKSP